MFRVVSFIYCVGGIHSSVSASKTLQKERMRDNLLGAYIACIAMEDIIVVE